MGKILRCADLGYDCKWEGWAETEEELYQLASEHAASAHNMKQIPNELWEKAKTVMSDS